MSQDNERAAQRAHRNVGLPDEEYDNAGRPAAARAHDAERAEGTGPDRSGESNDG